MKRLNIQMLFESLGLLLIILFFGWIGFLPVFLYCYFSSAWFILVYIAKRETVKKKDMENNETGSGEESFFKRGGDSLIWQDDSEASPLYHYLKNVKTDQLSVGWINQIVSKLWRKTMAPRMTTEVFQQFLANLCRFLEEEGSKWADFLKNVTIEEVSLGECPFQITQITAVESKEDLIFNVGVIYPGNGIFSLKWNHPELNGSAKNLGFAFKLKVVMGPFHRDFTVLNGMSVSLLERPVLTLEGNGIFFLPVELTLQAMRFIMPMTDWMLVDPKHIHINFPTQGFHYPVMSTAAGVLNVLLIEGKGIRKVDGTFKETGIKSIDKKFKLACSDPFCIMRVGKTWMKSKSVKRTSNPKWNTMVQFPMMTQDFNEELVVEVWDDNTLTNNELLGLNSISLSKTDRNRQTIRHFLLDVASAKLLGKVKLFTQFVPCSKNGDTSILVIFIKSVRTSQPIEPIVSVQISGQNFFSTTKGSFGHTHEFFEEIPLIVENINVDLLKVGVHDGHTEELSVGKYFSKQITDSNSQKENYLKRKVIGDKIYPVKDFLGKEGEIFSENLNQNAEVNTYVEFEVRLFPLENTIEDLKVTSVAPMQGLHKAVFVGDVDKLYDLLSAGSVDVAAKDMHGNTALHLAVMLGRRECAELLLEHGAPTHHRNTEGWTPLEEAISYGDRGVITGLLRRHKQYQEMQIKRMFSREMVEGLKILGDFSLQLSWECSSWMPIGWMLPFDTWKISKCGSSVRIDLTLLDLKRKNWGWDRGDFTILFCPESEDRNESLCVMDNNAQEYRWICFKVSNNEIDEEVDWLMSNDIEHAHISTKSITFDRAKAGWIWKENRSERFGNYDAEFYTVNGMEVHITKRREHLSKKDLKRNRDHKKKLVASQVVGRASLPPPPGPKMTWEEYSRYPPDQPPVLARDHVVKTSSISLKPTVVMSEEFPMKMDMFLEMLDVIEPQFSHLDGFNKFRDLLESKVPPGFPIQLDIPVPDYPLSIKLTLSDFSWIKEGGVDKSRFSIPAHYEDKESKDANSDEDYGDESREEV